MVQCNLWRMGQGKWGMWQRGELNVRWPSAVVGPPATGARPIQRVVRSLEMSGATSQSHLRPEMGV